MNSVFQQIKNYKEEKAFLECVEKCYDIYFKHGCRSSKKVDFFHNFILKRIQFVINQSKFKEKYEIKTEQNIKSLNSTGYKKCDIVVFKDKTPYIVFPVKIIMTNYKQNKNNSWENLTGELVQLKWADKELNIIPINVFFSKTPYLDNKRIIKRFENINNNDILIYNELKRNNLAYDVINYIINVKHIDNINNTYSIPPLCKNISGLTVYISFYERLKNLID